MLKLPWFFKVIYITTIWFIFVSDGLQIDYLKQIFFLESITSTYLCSLFNGIMFMLAYSYHKIDFKI